MQKKLDTCYNDEKRSREWLQKCTKNTQKYQNKYDEAFRAYAGQIGPHNVPLEYENYATSLRFVMNEDGIIIMEAEL